MRLKYLKITFFFIAFLMLISLFSCKENSVDENSNGHFETFSLLTTYKSDIITSLYYSIIGDTDALQIASISETVTDYSGSVEIGVESSSTLNFYNINGSSGQIDYLKVEGQLIPYVNEGMHYKYSKNWFAGTYGLLSNSNIEFEFKMGSNIVHDTLWLPNSFGPVTFSSDSLDISNGITVNWAPRSIGTGDIAITPMYHININDKPKLVEGETIYTTDKGTFNFTSSFLTNELKVPANAGLFSVHLVRGTAKNKEFDNGDKTVGSVVFIEKKASVQIK